MIPNQISALCEWYDMWIYKQAEIEHEIQEESNKFQETLCRGSVHFDFLHF
jgi:alanyl-tRNA synthetase